MTAERRRSTRRPVQFRADTIELHARVEGHRGPTREIERERSGGREDDDFGEPVRSVLADERDIRAPGGCAVFFRDAGRTGGRQPAPAARRPVPSAGRSPSVASPEQSSLGSRSSGSRSSCCSSTCPSRFPGCRRRWHRRLRARPAPVEQPGPDGADIDGQVRPEQRGRRGATSLIGRLGRRSRAPVPDDADLPGAAVASRGLPRSAGRRTLPKRGPNRRQPVRPAMQPGFRRRSDPTSAPPCRRPTSISSWG